MPLVDTPPPRLQLGRKPGHGGHRGNQRHQSHQAEAGAGDNDQRQGSDEPDSDIHTKEQAHEQKVLKTADIGTGAGDQFSSAGVVMPGKGAPLERVVHGGANIAQGGLGGPVSDGAEYQTHHGSEHDESDEYPDQGPEGATARRIAESGDGGTQELGQRQLDADIEQEESDGQRCPTGSLAQETHDETHRGHRTDRRWRGGWVGVGHDLWERLNGDRESIDERTRGLNSSGFGSFFVGSRPVVSVVPTTQRD